MRLPCPAVACLLIIVAAASAAAEDWPQFRGPTGAGLSRAEGLPVEWGPERSVVWRTGLPGLGWSSPVVQGERIYLTTAVPTGDDEDGPQSLRALCLDADSGQIVWNNEVFQQPADRIHRKNSHASPTPIVDGERLFVHFGTHGTACLTTGGAILWKQSAIEYDMVHGTGGSPVLVDGRLVFSCDGSEKPFVVALDADTGRIAWRKERPAVSNRKTFSFGTPLVIEVDGRRQVVSPATDQVIAYDPQSGDALWSAKYDGYSVIPRPVFGHGLLFLSTSYDRPKLVAIRPPANEPGEQNGTQTEEQAEVVWQADRGAPHAPSPLLVGDELYTVSDGGIASCFDAVTGEVHWQQRLGGNYSASPLFGDGKVYFQSEQGVGTVIAAGTTFEKLAENDLQTRTLASYAVVGSDLLIRTDQALYRIGR